MRVSSRYALMGCLWTAAVSVAQADVVYDFVGFGGLNDRVAEGFVFTSPTFITATTDVAPSFLDSCSIAGSTCSDVLFSPSGLGGPLNQASSILVSYPIIGLGTETDNFYFPFGSFGAPAAYREIYDFHPATLTVTQTGTVPGPTVWVPLGLIVAFWAIRRFRTEKLRPLPIIEFFRTGR